MARPRTSPQPEVPGLAARRIAADILDGVLRRRTALDELLSGKNAHPGLAGLAERDRALMRRLVATVLRRLGTLRHLVGGFLDKGFPSDAPRAETILLLGAAQILWLEVPDHAAVDLSVRLAQADRRAARYAGLVNAVLRRVTQSAATKHVDGSTRDTPEWLLKRWKKAYGPETARAIATANGHEPALDLTVNKMPNPGPSDCAAAYCRPAPCAHWPMARFRCCRDFPKAPGGCRTRPPRCRSDCSATSRARASPNCARRPAAKPRNSRLAGAKVSAVDRSPARLNRMRENLARLSLAVETVAADAMDWQAGPFDGVLLDAPCSSTGTIRRHPDIPWLKNEADLPVLTSLQQRLIDRAVDLTKPGGTFVYCVCSLEPEEGENQIEALLARDPRVTRSPISPQEVFGHAEFVTADGDLRTLPLHCLIPIRAGLDSMAFMPPG